MKKGMVVLLEFFISKRLHIGVLSFITALFLMRCIGINNYHPIAPFISFFVVWAAYLENLTTDRKEDYLGQVPHGVVSFIESKLYPIEKFYPLFYLIALVLSLVVSAKCFLYTICAIVIFSSYVQSWIPSWASKKRRLKEIFIVKNLVPPLGWMFSTEVIPFVTSGSLFIKEYILLLAIVFLWQSREEIKFDIPDSQGDKRAGIKTFPNLFGDRFTTSILKGINYTIGILFFATFAILKINNRPALLNHLLINMFPLVIYLFLDYNFVALLFKKRKKEFCNLGIIWWSILLIIYLGIRYPYNIIIFLFLKILGNFASHSMDVMDYFINFIKSHSR